MTTQFGRSFKLQVGDIAIASTRGSTALRVEFEIERDKKRDPDTATFAIYNLKPEHRASLESQTEIPVVFEGGYQDNTQQLFAGLVRRAVSQFEGGNTWVTTVKVGDGERPKIALARLNKNYAKNTPLRTTLNDLIKATELQAGNVQDVIDAARMAGQDKWLRSKTIAGPPMSELYRLVRSFGFGYTIQDGVFVFHNDTSATESGVVLTPSSGLIGVPKLDSKGKVSFQALLTADVVPQALVEIRSLSVTGKFVVEKSKHSGDSASGDWTVTATGKPYS